MNSRIEIVSDTEAKINRHGTGWLTELKVMDDGTLHIISESSFWDAEGRAALRDCINCLDATGSFAALADTSAVPYVGKQMRESSTRNERTVVDIQKSCGKFTMLRNEKDGIWYSVCTNTLLPLTEPPKYRAMTPVELAQHLGREVCWQHRYYYVEAAHLDHVELSEDNDCTPRPTYAAFLQRAKWRDTGEPCGIPEA